MEKRRMKKVKKFKKGEKVSSRREKCEGKKGERGLLMQGGSFLKPQIRGRGKVSTNAMKQKW